MATLVKIGGTWVDRTLSYIKQGGTWVLGSAMFYKSGSTWVSQDGIPFPSQIITPERWYNLSADDPLDITTVAPAQSPDANGFFENRDVSSGSTGTATLTNLGYADGKGTFRLTTSAGGTQIYKFGLSTLNLGSDFNGPSLSGSWRFFWKFTVSSISVSGAGQFAFIVQDRNTIISQILISANGLYEGSVDVTTTSHQTFTNFGCASLGGNGVANATVEIDHLYTEPR